MTIYNDKGSLERWLKVVRDIIGKPTQDLSLLDLCCGECTGTSQLKWDHHVAVDVVNWPTRKPVDLFFKEDALTFITHEGAEPDNRFDMCICSDGIEHLTKPQGLKLLTEMRRVAHLSIIFTPLDDYLVEPNSTHPDTHRSGWTPEELEALGWQVKAYPNWHSTLGVGAFFAYSGGL